MTKERFSTLFDGYMRERKLSSRKLDAVTMVNRTTIDNWRKGNSLPQDPVQLLTVARAIKLVKCQVDELLSEASHQSIDFMNQPNAPQGIKDALEPWIKGELSDGDTSLPTADASNQDDAPVSRGRHWVSWQRASVRLGILGIIGISVFIFWRNHGMADNTRGMDNATPIL